MCWARGHRRTNWTVCTPLDIMDFREVMDIVDSLGVSDVAGVVNSGCSRAESGSHMGVFNTMGIPVLTVNAPSLLFYSIVSPRKYNSFSGRYHSFFSRCQYHASGAVSLTS